jgi:hypothetical protein
LSFAKNAETQSVKDQIGQWDNKKEEETQKADYDENR